MRIRISLGMCETLSRGEFKAGIDGVFDVLASQQVPFEFVSEKGVQEGGLEGFKVLVLPNTTHLAGPTVEAIANFVEKGGGLVATFRAGANDEDGKARADNPIALLAGVSMGSVVSWSEDRTYPDLDAQVPIPSIDLDVGRPYFRYVRVAEGAAVADGAGQDVSSKGVSAHALTADQAASNLEVIRARLTHVIRGCADLSNSQKAV